MAAESILGELSCAICLDPFTEPVTLPCLHSFCKKCVEDVHNASRGSLKCPECRMDINLGEKGLDGLPKNFTIAKLVEKCKETPEVAKLCGVCDSSSPNTAVKTCKQCDISYCQQCLAVMHPNRGAFVRHEMIDEVLAQDDGPSPAKICRLDESSGEIDVNSPVFCPSCCKMIMADKREVHRRLNHQVISLQEARKQKQANAQSCLQNLEKHKEDVMRSITNSESNLELIPDETRLQRDGLTRCVERISDMITEKRIELEKKVKEYSTGLTMEIETQLSEKRRFYSGELKEAMNDFNELLENKEMEDAQFVEAAVKLEQRILTLEAVIGAKLVVKPLAVDNIVLTKAKLIEKGIQEVLEEKNIPAQQTDGNPNKILRITSAEPVWRYKEGCISVSWAWEDEPQNKPVDLRLSCTSREIRMTNIPQQLKVDKLDFLTTYSLMLFVDGLLACEAKTVKTFDDVVGKGFLLDAKTASYDVNISVNGKTMIHQDNSHRRHLRLSKILGAGSTRTVDGVYWETKLSFSMRRLKDDGETAFEIGICDDSKLERAFLLRQNKFAYVCGAARRGATRGVLEFYSEGRECAREKVLPWEGNFSLHLGYFLNLQRQCFSIVDVKDGTLLHEFNGIQHCESYLAVCSLGEGEMRAVTTIELLTGRDLKTIPNVVFQLL